MVHKRELSGTIILEGQEFEWTLRREPQWCTADGWQGMLISVCRSNGEREVLIQFPMPKGIAQRARGYRHRPQVQKIALEQGVQKALSLGWEPNSRGKPFHVAL